MRRVVWHGPFPRFGWGPCGQCRKSRLLFYVNALYPTDREAGRNALSETICAQCIDAASTAKENPVRDQEVRTPSHLCSECLNPVPAEPGATFTHRTLGPVRTNLLCPACPIPNVGACSETCRKSHGCSEHHLAEHIYRSGRTYGGAHEATLRDLYPGTVCAWCDLVFVTTTEVQYQGCRGNGGGKHSFPLDVVRLYPNPTPEETHA